MLPCLQVEPSDGATVTVFGDTHGQLHDVLHALRTLGAPGPKRLYVFNGAAPALHPSQRPAMPAAWQVAPASTMRRCAHR